MVKRAKPPFGAAAVADDDHHPRDADRGILRVRTVMAGWRPSLSRQRRRPDPMLPAGMPSLALISAYGSAGSSMSRAGSCWQPGAAARTPHPGPRKFGREQVLLGRLSDGRRGNDPCGRRIPSAVGSRGRAQGAAAFALGRGGQPAGERGRVAQAVQVACQLGPDVLGAGGLQLVAAAGGPDRRGRAVPPARPGPVSRTIHRHAMARTYGHPGSSRRGAGLYATRRGYVQRSCWHQSAGR